MEKAKEYVRKKVEKHKRKFSAFLLVGILKTVFTIFITWLIIDILKVKALIGSILVGVIIFLLTYVSYVMVNVIKARFIRYTIATVSLNIIMVFLIWFFVDIVGLTGAFSSAISVVALFLIRYLLFNLMGLIKHD